MRSRAGGRVVLHPDRIIPENIFPAHDPAEKKSGATGVQRIGKNFECAGPVRPGFVGAGSPALVSVACGGAGPGFV